MVDNVKIKPNNKKKIYRIISIVTGIIVALICISLNYFTKNYLYNGKISENTFIQGIEVSNMSKKEAMESVNEKYKPSDLKLSYNGNNYEISHEDINLQYNTKQLVEQAYNATRSDSYFDNIKSYMDIKSKGQEYSIKVTYNEKSLDKYLENIAKTINKDAKNATVSVNNGINITNSTTGLEFETKENKDLVTKALNNKKYETIDLKVAVVNPRISTEDVISINTKLASFSTDFNSGLVERSFNIGLSAKRCNNVILKPGETFSYNEHTGMRLLSNGFLNAPIILSGNYIDAPGGGVCQTSTTLFNAALLSGLEINQVTNHSKTSHYASRGRDAMVNDGGSDLKFTNNFDHAVYISCYRSGSSVIASIYGAKEDKVNVNIRVDNFTSNGLPGAKTYRTITKGNNSTTSHIYTSVYRQ